jgi:spermidine synthase
MIEEFIERDGESIRIFRYNPENSVTFKTARQDVAVLDTLLFGRTLFLNGILQSSEKDEELYHRMLVHTVMGTDRDIPKNVLIVGGGEGATLREVLKWKDIASVTMLDWDEELVNYFRSKEPTWHCGAFDDPRVTLEHSDIFLVINEQRKYDRIFVDLVDPDLKHEAWRNLFKKLAGWLEPKGSMSINAGGVFPWDDGDVPEIEKILHEEMQGKGSYHISRSKKWVPSFGREWAFVILKKR